MNRKTLSALKKSIKHWEENVEKAKNGELSYLDILPNKCALCVMFLLFSDCFECPIYKKVKNVGCRKTPYIYVIKTLKNKNTANIFKACKKELAFLKSLLPVKKK